eukprot:10007026-Ditylum_brightwellii.AAC.1
MPHALVESPKGVQILDLHMIKEVWRSTIPLKMQMTQNVVHIPTKGGTYIKTLKPWEQYLLRNLKEVQKGYRVLKLMIQLREKIRLATDGDLDKGV